ncbi:uncharacterized protein BP5553_03489 [Venustampulla echinocandica]|uniref:Carboxylic ester hydrolase n=1 Tax=Venustampulla echinocandica TaxID=2656787 RepID=A0A370TUF5_9HELO|nr:uncharacterized protein BP5553_03489 [Venustampulla echinocandica]RDL39149.1 hypothetical protein BP5553_03489 [Venustampulla echinocandica]
MPDSASRPRVTIRQGTIVGARSDRNHGKSPQVLDEFLGIPYALSTAGERRFRPPVPVGASNGEFDAGQYGYRCPAGDADETPLGEDCLNLNIYRPGIQYGRAKLPVLVHIHGGSFNFGAGNNRQISSFVAWSKKPFIGISFNYRLGAFGFLSSKLMGKEGLLNVGLKDQQLLLQWVKDNIAAFGGDPDDVTIMGSSAGAHSVGHHLLNNPDKPPLFHKAIIESGGATARAVRPYDNSLFETQFQEFISHAGLLDVPSDKLIDQLRALPWSKIKAASETIYGKYDTSVRWPFQPVIDGEGGIIPIAPIKAWQAGKWHQVPILTGFNTNEGAIFIEPTISTSAQFTSFFATLLPTFSPDDLEALGKVYPDPITHPSSPYTETRKNIGLGAQFFRTEQAYGHYAYIAPVRQTARFASKGPAPVYLYHYAVTGRKDGGADHGDHNDFVTYSQEIRNVSPSVMEISANMHAYWTSFITTGDPNTEGGLAKERPTWPKYDYAQGVGKVALFGEGNDELASGNQKGVVVKIVDDLWAKEECQFWMERTGLSEI